MKCAASRATLYKRWKKKSIQNYSRRTTTTTKKATKEEEGFVRTFDFPKTQKKKTKKKKKKTKKKKKKKTLVTELETVLRETKHERRLW